MVEDKVERAFLARIFKLFPFRNLTRNDFLDFVKGDEGVGAVFIYNQRHGIGGNERLLGTERVGFYDFEFVGEKLACDNAAAQAIGEQKAQGRVFAAIYGLHSCFRVHHAKGFHLFLHDRSECFVNSNFYIVFGQPVIGGLLVAAATGH